MLFLPLRAQTRAHLLPLVTCLVCVACLIIYGVQASNESRFLASAERYCARDYTNLELMFYAAASRSPPRFACLDFNLGATVAQDRERYIREHAASVPALGGLSQEETRQRAADFLHEEVQRFSHAVPPLRTRALWYHPHSWNVLAMLTSSFAHGSWEHVLGNLFFFFAFAASIEAAIGLWRQIVLIVALSLGTSVAYSLAMAGVPDALPTVGLSGVVMGMMGLFAALDPRGRIECFYWIIVKAGTVAIPAWVLFLFYAGFDAWNLTHQSDMGGVNLVEHVAGAAIGVTLGLTVLRGYRAHMAAA